MCVSICILHADRLVLKTCQIKLIRITNKLFNFSSFLFQVDTRRKSFHTFSTKYQEKISWKRGSSEQFDQIYYKNKIFWVFKKKYCEKWKRNSLKKKVEWNWCATNLHQIFKMNQTWNQVWTKTKVFRFLR